MLEGISTNRLCESSAACLASSGKSFVIRYYSRTTRQAEKQLRPREAAELARAGLHIAVVYQDRGRETDDFNLERGRLDGASAFASAGQVGQPAGSAIYFAVDTDFSAAQIRQFVIPYFQGVRQSLGQASGGASIYRVGVYGSGLTCRLLKIAGLAEFTWLAEATGWTESRSYSDFDVRQFVTDQPLCVIGNGWQRCIARPQFGQFQPAGFEVRGTDAPTMQVKATQLNLRFVPSADNNDPITQLPQGTAVVVLGESAPGWVRVRVNLSGATYIGHVKAAHLEPLATTPTAPPVPRPVPAVYFGEQRLGAPQQHRRSRLADRRGRPAHPRPVRQRRPAPAAAHRHRRLARRRAQRALPARRRQDLLQHLRDRLLLPRRCLPATLLGGPATRCCAWARAKWSNRSTTAAFARCVPTTSTAG